MKGEKRKGEERYFEGFGTRSKSDDDQIQEQLIGLSVINPLDFPFS